MSMKIPFALSLAGVVALAGCMETMPGPDRPNRPRPERPAICTREYAPVCAVKRGKRQTFGNACMAKAEGFRIVDQRACSR